MQHWLFKSHIRTTKLVGYKSGGTVVGTNESEKQLLLKPLGVFSMFYTPMLVGHHTLVNRMTGFRATETIRSGRRADRFCFVGGSDRRIGSLCPEVSGYDVSSWRIERRPGVVSRSLPHLQQRVDSGHFAARKEPHTRLDAAQLYWMGNGRYGVSGLGATELLLVADPPDWVCHNRTKRRDLVFGLPWLADQDSRAQIRGRGGIQKTHPVFLWALCWRVRGRRFLGHSRCIRGCDALQCAEAGIPQLLADRRRARLPLDRFSVPPFDKREA